MYSIEEISDNTFIILLDGSQITSDTFLSQEEAMDYINGLQGSQDD